MLREIPTYVPLPDWIWEEARDKEHFIQVVQDSMKRYKHLRVKKVLYQKRLAVCVKR